MAVDFEEGRDGAHNGAVRKYSLPVMIQRYIYVILELFGMKRHDLG